MDKTTPREALVFYKNAAEFMAARINAVKGIDMPKTSQKILDDCYKVLEALVLATEQAPTLEKLGYVRKENQVEGFIEDISIRRRYENKNGTQIIFQDFLDKETGVYKMRSYHVLPLSFPELLACAEVIKEMEKEKV